jgi:uncharacterized protein
VAYSLYDAAVTPCAQQLDALAGIIDKAAAHCVSNKIEESALLQDRLYKGNDYLQQFALPNFFFFVTTAYNILRHRGVPLGKRDFLGPVNWL